MALISRIPRDHTTHLFRSAARQRFEEAKRSASAGDRLIGVYLCGYSAEMLLKAAYFRLVGKKPADPITSKDLAQARGYANTTLKIGWSGNLHDLPSWKALLIEERKLRGSPYPPGFNVILSTQVSIIHSNWREFIRYHTNRPRSAEVSATFQAVAWLMSSYPSL